MARRTRPHPSTMPQAEVHSDAQLMGGAPNDGDAWNDEAPSYEREERREPPRDDPLAELRREFQREVDSLKRDNDNLRRAIPPSAPREPEPDEEEPDWDQLLFANPKEALRQYGERVATQVKNELRTEYQQANNTQTFWKEFYDAHSDLADDHDLVESTMNKHLSEIANIPANEAMDRLADLTRQRIRGFLKRGGETRRSGRAVVEGGSPPQTKQAAPEQGNITTLKDLITARRAKRRGASAA
jgi:hypothetical protein